jgi:hypothetical protein
MRRRRLSSVRSDSNCFLSFRVSFLCKRLRLQPRFFPWPHLPTFSHLTHACGLDLPPPHRIIYHAPSSLACMWPGPTPPQPYNVSSLHALLGGGHFRFAHQLQLRDPHQQWEGSVVAPADEVCPRAQSPPSPCNSLFVMHASRWGGGGERGVSGWLMVFRRTPHDRLIHPPRLSLYFTDSLTFAPPFTPHPPSSLL